MYSLWTNFKRLSRDQLWDYWDYENFIYELPGKWEMSFYLEINNNIIGYCINSIKHDCVWLHHIIIDESFRNRGIGNIILKELERRTKEKTIFKEIGLKVGAENYLAQRFYDKAGFEIEKYDKDYITMKKFI